MASIHNVLLTLMATATCCAYGALCSSWGLTAHPICSSMLAIFFDTYLLDFFKTAVFFTSVVIGFSTLNILSFRLYTHCFNQGYTWTSSLIDAKTCGLRHARRLRRRMVKVEKAEKQRRDASRAVAAQRRRAVARLASIRRRVRANRWSMQLLALRFRRRLDLPATPAELEFLLSGSWLHCKLPLEIISTVIRLARPQLSVAFRNELQRLAFGAVEVARIVSTDMQWDGTLQPFVACALEAAHASVHRYSERVPHPESPESEVAAALALQIMRENGWDAWISGSRDPALCPAHYRERQTRRWGGCYFDLQGRVGRRDVCGWCEHPNWHVAIGPQNWTEHECDCVLMQTTETSRAAQAAMEASRAAYVPDAEVMKEYRVVGDDGNLW